MIELDKAWEARERQREAARGLMYARAEQAATNLVKLIEGDDTPHAVRLSAINSLLDRTGLKATDKLELTGKDGGKLELRVDMSKATDEELEAAAKFWELRAKREGVA